jgi:pimeloyl-ACP methyl ester carboxylesterase
MISAKDVFQQLTSGPGIMDNVCNFVIRPPRSDYEIDDLGPVVFRIGDDGKQRFMRHDFDLENMRGLRFQCSWFKPYPAQRTPCVVYCHANCSGRYDALEALFVLHRGMSLFCFDFCGSGMSEGEYISLGFYERQDLAAVMEFLTLKSDEVDGVALWGRSMGAVTAIMYASKDPWVRCIVCDSPFATLRVLINDLVERHGGRTARVIPNAVVQAIVERIRKRIMKRAAFDIDDLDTVKYARVCRVPALLFYGADDDFVTSRHCEMIRDAFPIPCLQQYTPGGHNDERDEEIQKVIAAFLHLYLIDKPNGDRELRAQQAAAQATSMPAATASAEAAASPPSAAAGHAASPMSDNNNSPTLPRTSSSSSSAAAPRTAASTSPVPDDVSITSSELHRRFCSLQATPSPFASSVLKGGEANKDATAALTTAVPAALIATRGIGELFPVDVRKDVSPSASVPDSHAKPASSTPDRSSGGKSTEGATTPQRPAPLFSATESAERVGPPKSPTLSRTKSNRGDTSSSGRTPNLSK